MSWLRAVTALLLLSFAHQWEVLSVLRRTPVVYDKTGPCRPPSQLLQKKGPPLLGKPDTISAMLRPMNKDPTVAIFQPHIAARAHCQSSRLCRAWAGSKERTSAADLEQGPLSPKRTISRKKFPKEGS